MKVHDCVRKGLLVTYLPVNKLIQGYTSGQPFTGLQISHSQIFINDTQILPLAFFFIYTWVRAS